ncbi:MAG: RNA chaperone Hfq [Firmicutes bacterium]|nr:RNA chaperone Hfq [Bacillota bacterium]
MVAAGLQNHFLDAVCKNGIPATFYLVNGLPLKGRLQAFDAHTLLVESHGVQQLIFKHAVSTVIPETPVALGDRGCG